MPSTFTAHEFIQTLSQQHQALYIEALHHYVGSEEPFTTVHQMLGQQLHDFSHLIKKIGDVPSKNLFNKDSTVSQWEKVQSQTNRSCVGLTQSARQRPTPA